MLKLKLISPIFGNFYDLQWLPNSQFNMKVCFDILPGRFNDLAEMCTTMVAYVLQIFNITYCQIRYGHLFKTINLMNKSSKARTAKGLADISSTHVYNRAMKTVSWLSSCFVATFLWSLYPLTDSNRNLPLKCLNEIKEKQLYVYGCLYVFQVIAQSQLDIAFPKVVSIYVSLLVTVCGQFDIFYCSSKKLTFTVEIDTYGATNEIQNIQNPNSMENEEINQYYCSLENHEILHILTPGRSVNTTCYEEEKLNALRTAIAICLLHRRDILLTSVKIESCYRCIKIVQIELQICFMDFFIAKAKILLFRSINFRPCLFDLTLTDLILFPYFSETLFQHSSRVAEGLARSNCCNESFLFRKDIQILLAGFQIEIKLIAGKLTTKDIEKWKLVLETTSFFFTFLQNLK